MVAAARLAPFVLSALVAAASAERSPLQVVDRQGRPVAGASLACDGEPAGTADAEGRWQEPAACEALGVEAEGYLPWSGVPAPRIELTRPSSIRVRVLDAETLTPLVGTEVTVRRFEADDDAPPVAAGTVGPSGWLELGALRAGEYRVRASASDHRAGARAAAVAPEGRDTLTLELAPTATLRGRVVVGDEAVAGARVFGRWAQRSWSDPEPPEGTEDFEVECDEAGVFVVEGVPRRRSSRLALLAFDEDGRWGLSEVPASEHSDRALAPPVATIDLEARREITGLVLDSGRAPVMEAPVVASPEVYCGRLAELFEGEDPFQVSSAEDGGFRLALPPLRRWTLQAGSEELGRSQAEHVDSSQETPEGIELVLFPSERNALLVHDIEGLPIEGALLRGEGLEARSDSIGRILLPSVTRSVPVTVTAEGYTTWSGSLSARTRHRKKDVLLEPAGGLEGRIFDAATGGPLSRFRVVPHREVDRRLVPQRELAEEIATADGSFRLDGLAAGRWAVEVQADGYLPASSETTEVVVGQSGLVEDLELAPGHAVEGRVVDAASGEGVVGARVAHDGREVVTGLEGRFAFEGLPGGQVTLTARHPDYPRLESGQVRIDPAMETEVVLRLQPGGSVAGELLHADGSPVPKGRVVASRADGRPFTFGSAPGYSAIVRDGRFFFRRLPPGELRLGCNHGCSSAVRVTVLAGETTEVVLRDAGVRVRGRIWLDGEPYRRGTVLAGSWRKQPITTIENSLYEYASVPVGEWTVSFHYRAANGEYFETSAPLVVPEGVADLPLDLHFSSDGRGERVRVAGEVRDAESGELLSGVTLSCRWQRAAAADGRFELELPDGTHRVSGEKEGWEVDPIEVTLAGGELTSGPVVLPARRTRSVEVFVKDGAGRPVTSALCLLSPGGPWEQVWLGIREHWDGGTDLRGRCTPEAHAPGTHDLLVFGSQGLVIRPRVEVPADEPVTLHLGGGGSLLIEGAQQARLREESTGHGWSWPLDRHGVAPLSPWIDAEARTIRLNDLQPGRYTVRVDGRDHAVVVEPGDETRLDVR